MTSPLSSDPSQAVSRQSPPSRRTELKRGAIRADYEAETVRAILEDGMLCHLGVSLGEHPAVIPTVYGLIGDQLYLHGSTANRIYRALVAGAEACLCVTLVDGLVLSRSAFHHSMNYRSVVLYGRVRQVDDEAEKLAAFESIIEHMVPGRYAATRTPNREEILRTLVLALPLAEASAKVRTGPPAEEEDDYALSYWGGEIPLRVVADAPLADARNTESLPAHVEARVAGLGGGSVERRGLGS
jgi:nitroimidazol reductase NimA-like FMN-containing flavoprotein (pyridoxamine 5'-phosphate oxidase superfamily)